ncbi:heterokaryon incompatibility protein-domain-containing protein [Stachybotrys elegans]|uniref:Heterokaryon incompatibility protein-domain-containing protein n=1 Tax=Stachybotrys elegans TaxID=80388 RepID=A0A8K0SXW9_9HYPO|nr:heterokaryon incompatibility protein-domain-containing protein [Stachybotrys elegans]
MASTDSVVRHTAKATKPAPYFNYSPLPAGFIRLVRIESGRSTTQLREVGLNNRISISLHEYDLASCPRFTALSYTWGDPLPPKQDERRQIFTEEPRCYPINCEGSIILCTRNLRDALRRFQHFQQIRMWPLKEQSKASPFVGYPHPEFFWIDALCIDQDDLEERSAQVILMGSIYQKAENCLVWLGEDDQETAKAVRIFSFFDKKLNLASKNGMPDAVSLRQLGKYFRCLDEGRHVAINKLLSRRWFSRLWILQEIILAREVLTVCGQLVFDFCVLLGYGTAMVATGQSRSALHRHLRSDAHMWNRSLIAPTTLAHIGMVRAYLPSQKTLDRTHRPEFQQITYLASVQDVMDDRDKIYGILNIAEELRVNARSLDVDYKLPVEKVYLNATILVGKTRNDLSFLSHVGNRDERKYGQLPSWCPDYSHADHSTQVGQVSISMDHSSLWESDEEPDIEYISDQYLVVNGFCCDTIAHTAIKPVQPSNIVKLALHIRRSPTKTRVESLWRCLLTDWAQGGIPSTAFGLFFPYAFVMLLTHFIGSIFADDHSTCLKRCEDEYDSLLTMLSTLQDEEPSCEPFLPDLERLRNALSVFIHSKEAITQDILTTVEEELLSNEITSITARAKKHGLNVQLEELIPSIFEMTIENAKNELLIIISNVWRMVAALLSHKSLYVTDKFQLLGLTLASVLKGDQIWFLHGFHSPVILRPLQNGRYRFHGATYIQDFMSQADKMRHDKTRIQIE